MNTTDQIFLKKDSIVNKTAKELTIKQKTTLNEESKSKNNVNYLIQKNPNVNKLAQDIRVNPSLINLKEDLKKEFGDFLSLSINKSIEKFKSIDDNFETSKENSIFLTQIVNPFTIEFQKYNHIIKSEEPISTLANPISNNKQKMEISLIKDNNYFKENNSLSKVKQVIQTLKISNLPNFQTEFNQLCQFEDDPIILRDINEKVFNEKNNLGRICLHECCIRGNVKLLESLLENIKNINDQDNKGYTAAHISAKFGQLECLKILYENDIDLKIVDNKGKNVLHLAAEFNHPKIIHFCVEIGLSLDCKCDSGKTPLHYASEFGSLEALKEIYSIDITVLDNYQNSAAHLAVQNDKLSCLKYLVSLGLPVNLIKNKMGRNVPHEACFYGAINCLHWMFKTNLVNIEVLDDIGNSLAHTCCISGQAECLNCCIQHNVDMNFQNSKLESPLETARKVGKGFYMEKAIKNVIKCKKCEEEALEIKFLKENETSEPEQIIEKNYSKMYHQISIKSKRQINSFENINHENVKRDLVVQFFGPDI